MGIKYIPCNLELKKYGQIRLVNESGKNLGVFELEKAIEVAKQDGKDVILVNEKVSPTICRTINYEDLLHQKFIDEMINNNQTQKKKDNKLTVKNIQINAKISQGDLKNKAQQAIEFSKKFDKLKVFMLVNSQNIDNSKNIIHTFQDLVSESMTSKDGLIEKKIDNEKQDKDKEKEIQESGTVDPQVQLEIEFSSIQFKKQQETPQYTTQEIKQLVAKFLSRKEQIQRKQQNSNLKDIQNDPEIQQMLRNQGSNKVIDLKSENLDYLNSEEFINKTKNEILESASNFMKDERNQNTQQDEQNIIQSIQLEIKRIQQTSLGISRADKILKNLRNQRKSQEQ